MIVRKRLLRQRKNVPEAFRASLHYLAARYNDAELAHALTEVAKHFVTPPKFSRYSVWEWRTEGRIPHSDAKIYAVLMFASAQMVRAEKDRRFCEALGAVSAKMSEFELSPSDMRNYLNTLSERDPHIVKTLLDDMVKTLPDNVELTVDERKIRDWRRDLHKLRKQKAGDFLEKHAEGLKDFFGETGFSIFNTTPKLPNELEIAVHAKIASETGLTERVRDALRPIMARYSPKDYEISSDEMKKLWQNLVKQYRITEQIKAS